MIAFHFTLWENCGLEKFKHLFQVPRASRWESQDFNISESKTHNPDHQPVLLAPRTNTDDYSRPSVSFGIGFRTPSDTKKSKDTQVSYIKWCSISHNLCLHIGYSRVCLYITSFVWIQRSAHCMANSSFAYWNILCFLPAPPPTMFNPWLVGYRELIVLRG